MDEVVKEFLIESHENLNQLDHDLIELEKDPHSKELLGSVFRTIHSIKGVSGFLDFPRLEALTHAAEELLSKLRDGELVLNQAITSVLLATVDAVRQMLAKIEADGNEGDEDYAELVYRLAEQCSQESSEAPPSSAGSGPPAPTVEEPIATQPEAASVQPEAVAAPIVETGTTPQVSRETTAPRPAAPLQAPPMQIAKAPEPAAAASNPPTPRGEAPAREDAPEVAASAAAESSIRVDVRLLDKLMNLVGELVLVRNQILQISYGVEESALLGASQRLNLITTELQEGIMKTRMQPIGNIWNKFPRIVRDLALICGKQVRIEMEGEETELDKTLIEAIRDPLTHIVRNSIDHGIEAPALRTSASKPAEGRLFLRAYHESGQVNIEISDDGAGIDVARVKEKALERGLITHEEAARFTNSEALNLIFLPGFSTAAKVTNVSGRGVGMDVVKTNIEKIGGTVDIQSRPGNGTTLKIRIPLTLAIIPALVVTCNGDRYAIPQVSLIELVRLEGDEIGKRIETINGAPLYRLRGRLLPLVYLRRVLKLAPGVEADGVAPQAASIVVLQVGERQFGLVVDEVIDTEEIVVKPLGKQLKGIPAFAGATIMGDGRVALILDGLGIAQLSGVIGESREASRAEEQKAAGNSRGNSQTLLLFSAGDCDRLAIPLSMVARLEEFPREQIEHAAGDRVVQYRGQILPLVQLASVLGSSGAAESGDRPTQVVVIGDANRTIGLEVDAILDIVEEAVSATQMTNRPGLIGSAIVGQKVTDFLDLHSVIEQANSNWFEGRSASNVQTTILLVDDRAFSRSLLRGYLEMAKRTVLEASSAEEACKRLEREKVDTVAVSLDLPNGGAHAVLDYIRNRSDLADLPVLALREENQPGELSERFDDCQAKLNRGALLASVDRLLRNGRAGHTAAAEFAQTA